MYCGLGSMFPRNSASGASLFSGVPMSRNLVGEGAGVAQEGPPAMSKFLKQGLKQGLLVHSEQIVNGGGGRWISPLRTVLQFKHQSVL